MLDMNNPKITAILQTVHEKIVEKSNRFSRISDDIVLENMVLRLLVENSSFSPGACSDILREKYYMNCRIDDAIRIFRDYQINSADKRAHVLHHVEELVAKLEKALQGDLNSLKDFKASFKEMLTDERVRRPERCSNLVLAMLFKQIPELDVENDRERALNFGCTVCKYVIWDLEDAIKAAYREHSDRKAASKTVVSIEEYEKLLARVEEMERAWKQTDMLLSDLQKEFDERLEAVKLQEMTEFFGKLNSERYGCILDELLGIRKGMEAIRKSGYELPLEINGLLIMVKKLIQFIRDNHINPMIRPDSVHNVKVADVEYWEYEGSPFMDADEEKTVRVISPGWIYSDKDVQISRPKVKEEV